ncbi:MAG: mechanosensitive ion channel family protein [Actinomycetota bacterium]
MDLLRQTDADLVIDDSLTGTDWLTAGIILVASLALAIVAGRVLRRVVGRALGTGFVTILTARFVSYVIFLLGASYALSTLGVRIGPLLGALGLGGLVVALALQSLAESVVASVLIQARRPYTIGSTVAIDGELGTVVDVDTRTTILDTFDGREVRIPNSTVINTTIANLTRHPVRRSSLAVGVEYASDLEDTIEVLRRAIERVDQIVDEPAPEVLVEQFGASSIDLTILYWHASDVPSELRARSDLAVAVHQALNEADITIAFPQVVVWSGDDEGRSDEPPAPDVDDPPRRRLTTRRRSA